MIKGVAIVDKWVKANKNLVKTIVASVIGVGLLGSVFVVRGR